MEERQIKKSNRVGLMVYLDREIRKEFADLCKQMHMGQSTVLRNFILKILKEQKTATE